ncbi:MAG TPA: FecR domain-containing protein [Pyrinomonadaceae bacterium]|jgi:hypothetical protein|nr:FecR domain-containing protein [Pyrinomonadaceae bacterium]
MKHRPDLDAIIDKAAFAVRDEQIDDSTVEESAARVWMRVSQAAENSSSVTSEAINTMNTSDNAEHIRGCDDFQSLMPAYLEGKLSTARKLLLEDHSNECIPCRHELTAQRNLAAAKAATFIAPRHTASAKAPRRSGSSRPAYTGILRWSVAAAVVICVGIAGLFMYERLDLSGRTLAATVDNANGDLFVISDSQARKLTVGDQLQKGELVRTARDSNAVLRLADGSTVEMRERSEFAVTENMRGVTLRLDRGDVIVEAAKQDSGHLFVQTPDSLVSVKGTIFAVESGTKGSRVSVVQGEVKVNHAGKDETLLPGDQTTTNPGLEKTSVQQNIAWSRNASRYAGLVSDLAKLQRDVNQKVARPGVRHSSRFLDLVPENTVFYAALPNLSETLAESQRIMQERIKQNPALAEWWKGNQGAANAQLMKRVEELGSQLGDEIVVSGEIDTKGEPSGILVLGEVKNGTEFRTYLDQQIAAFAKESRDMPNVRIVEDPLTAAATSTKRIAKGDNNAVAKEDVFVWINGDIFAASPKIDTLRAFARAQKEPSANGFATRAFHQRIADVYKDGAGLLVAADLEKIVAKVVAKDNSPEAARHIDGLKQLGVMNLRDFVVEQKEVNGKTLSRAALTFSEPNRGIASWLAAPGSMGALDFISSTANVATAFVVKKPELLADDLLGFLQTVQPDVRQQLEEIEKTQGFSLRDDFAAPLGGEFAFAIDGPILPTPSWKIILEVYDQAKLQNTFERAIDKVNQFSMLHGKGTLSITSETSGGRTYYAIKSSTGALEVNYTYANGYMVAVPTRALLEQTMRNRDAGNTLVRSSRFMSALPQDGNTNFSAILYHDLAPLMGPLAERMKNAAGSVSEQELQKFGSIDANAPPTLAYAYAEGDRITLSANTEGGPFGFSPASLIGMPNSFEMQHILMNAMGDKDVKKKE